jgi:hypothetical protein
METEQIITHNTRVAIMQPYFFPYVGYFQTIKNCDVYVNLDHVSFKKSGYMTRNVIKDNNIINVEINNASSNKRCVDTNVLFKDNYFRKFKNKLYHLYSKNENYEIIIEKIINPIFIPQEITISQFNLNIIKKICSYLDIKTKIIDSSCEITDKKKESGVIEIVKYFNGNEYLNSIGGKNLYSFDNFKENNIKLIFIQGKNLDFSNPYTSILDLLFTHKRELIINNLNKFDLVHE